MYYQAQNSRKHIIKNVTRMQSTLLQLLVLWLVSATAVETCIHHFKGRMNTNRLLTRVEAVFSEVTPRQQMLIVRRDF